MTLLFNGRFKATDHYVNSGLFDSAYGHDGWNGTFYRSDSLVVAADSRFGYIGKFSIKPNEVGQTRDGRDRVQIQWTPSNVGASLQYKDIWESWSVKLDSPTWAAKETNNCWYALTSASSLNFWRPPGVSGEFGSTNLNFVGPSTTSLVYNFVYRDVLGDTNQENINVGIITPGYWYDFLFHVILARDNTGSFEFYVKEPDKTDYRLVTSKTNTPTQFTIHDYPDDVWMSKFGLYRGNFATTTRIMYHSGILIGTTRADVEPISECPTPQCNFTITQ